MVRGDTYIRAGGGGEGTHEGWGRAHRETPPPGPVCRGRGRQRRPERAGPGLGTALHWGRRRALRAREERGPRSFWGRGGKLCGQRWRASFCIAVGSSAVQAAPEDCALRVPKSPGSCCQGVRSRRAERGVPLVPGGDLLLIPRKMRSRRTTPYSGNEI